MNKYIQQFLDDNDLQCIYELTNKILDMQVKDKYLNPIVVDINQK